METQVPVVERNELIAYATDMLAEAMNDGYLEPLLVIECMQLAAKPALLAVMRALASLDESVQVEIIGFAHRISSQSGPSRSRGKANLKVVARATGLTDKS